MKIDPLSLPGAYRPAEEVNDPRPLIGDMIRARKKASRKSENRAASNFGGRTQIASGALRHAKGDVITPVYLIEDKITDKASYSLTLAVWRKIRLEAFRHQRTPMMRITISGQVLCVLAEDDFLQKIKT